MRKEPKPTTCGPMYQEGITKYGTTPEAMRAFAAGFVSGQAEKVYLGACQAAMFRPSEANLAWVTNIIEDVCTRYGLKCSPENTDRGRELWIARQGAIGYLAWSLEAENSMKWHLLRGHACGVPLYEIDLEFHKRRGFGETCDKAPIAPSGLAALERHEKEQGNG